MKSIRTDQVRNPISLTLPTAKGNNAEVGDDKNGEKGYANTKIPQMMPLHVARQRDFPKKAADGHIYETTRPLSATTRLPVHPGQLQGVRQVPPNKARTILKRPPNFAKKTLSQFRPFTPVIKVPISSESTRQEDPDTELTVSATKKTMQLKKHWQENMAKFESTRLELNQNQQSLLELYAKLRANHKKLSDMGQTMRLPPSEDLKIMNVAQLAPEQLLRLCAGPEVNHCNSELTNPPDLYMLREIPIKLVATCEESLSSRKEIIDWFEDVMEKKMITKNILVKKIEHFKSENEEFQKSLERNKEQFTRFLKDADSACKNGVNNILTNQLNSEALLFKLSETNALNDDLKKKLLESEQQAVVAENKIMELEKQLKHEKHKRRNLHSKVDVNSKFKEDKIEQMSVALEQAQSKCVSLENVVSKLREENQQLHSKYDKKLQKVNESIDINTKLFEEISTDRNKILAEKQELEKQLIELSKTFEESLHNARHDANLTMAKFIETEKTYKEVLEEKNKLAAKIESMCAQLLESELRFKDASVKITQAEFTTKELDECRRQVETLNYQLKNAKEELQQYTKIVTKQQQAIQELRQNWNSALSTVDQLKSDLNSKEMAYLDLEKQQTALEQRLLDSETKTKSYAEELSNLQHKVAKLQEHFGGFKTIDEFHEAVKRQNLQLLETNQQKDTLTEALKIKDMELQQRVKTLTEQGQLIEEQKAAMNVLIDKNEEQSNIIKLLRTNVEERTRADIEINQQIEEKNAEIKSLISNVEKRKQQILELEKIIINLENQVSKLKNLKRTAGEVISSLENKLSEYESYHMKHAKRTKSSTDNLDDLINILEYELTNPLDDKLNYPGQSLTGCKNKRGANKTNKIYPDNESDIDYSERKVANKLRKNNHLKHDNVVYKENHKGDGVSRNKVVTSERDALPKAVASVSEDYNRSQPIGHQTANVHYCLMPNYIKDERKLKMFKLAGHKMQ